jgi:hypothetical protein
MEQTTPKSQTERYDARGLWHVAILLVATAMIVAGTWAAYWTPNRNDQYQLLQLGRCVYDGGTLYVDCWENKPPGIAWINAFGFAIGDGRSIVAWLLPGLAGLMGIAVFHCAVTRVLGLVSAGVATVIAAMVFNLRIYDAGTINPDFYSAVFELVAASLWVLSLRTDRRMSRWGWALSAGLAWTCAVTVKQTGVAGLIVMTAVGAVAWVMKGDRKDRAVGSGLPCWLGFLVGVGAVVAILMRTQSLEPAMDAIWHFNAQFVDGRLGGGWRDGWIRIGSWCRPLQLPLWIALLGLAAALARTRSESWVRRLVAVFVLWWMVQAILATWGPSRSPRYFQATFAPMSWLTAVGVWHMADIVRHSNPPRAVVVVVMVTLAWLLGRPLLDHFSRGVAESVVALDQPQTERDRYRALGERVRALIDADERMYVWNYDSGVYVHARRAPAATYNYPRSARQMEAILAALENRRTKLLLIPKHRSSFFAAWCDSRCQQRVEMILAEFSEKEAIGQYQVWLRDER